jgi:hypothetical protein
VLACCLAAIAGGWLVLLNVLVLLTTSSVGVGAEAALFGLAGLGISITAVRAAQRAWRRRAEPTIMLTRAAAPSVVAEDDPMGRVRRRRFGAGD